MANLKKHFVFKVGANNVSLATNASPVSPELLLPGFSKSAFMNEVSALLEQCGLYVSSMNEFCSSGCSLAKCLVKVFHAVPLYKDTASSLLNNWEEIAQSTAATSASVKTETLMQLQDVLTRLESFGEKKEDDLIDSVHNVSTCLMAYIDLQARFSYSMSKTLSKLSRHTHGVSKTSRAEDAVRKQCSQIINRLTGPAKPMTPTSPPNQISTSQQNSQSTSTWPAEMHLAPSGIELDPSVNGLDASEADSGLDDVIHLLSIGSVGTNPTRSSSSSPCSSSTVPPKVPPRPDASSQDAFRLKKLEQSRRTSGAEKKNAEGTVWSPFDQWRPEWTPEEQKWSESPSAGTPTWSKWHTETSNSTASSTVKEKTFTWPRPLRDPSLPWELQSYDDGDENLDFESAGEKRDIEKLSKTCTWPLKIADNAWVDTGGDQWETDGSPSQNTRESTWTAKTGDGFRLFDDR